MLDLEKPVQTRDGRKARILCSDLDNVHPVIVAVSDSDGKERTYNYSIEGLGPHGSASYDLVNVPPQPKFFNVYKDLVGCIFDTPEEAADADKERHFSKRVACVPFLEGQGLGEKR